MFSRLHHKTVSIIAMCCCMALLLLSCQDDEIGGGAGNGAISFQITDDWKASTRNDASLSSDSVEHITPKQIPLLVDGQELSLTFDVKERVSTRGAILDNKNNLISSIYTTAIYEEGDGGRTYFKNAKITIDDNKGSSGYFWPIGNLSFMAYTWSKSNLQLPLPTFERAGGVCKGSFSYTLPGVTTNPCKDATAQPDIILAITTGQSKANNPVVNLEFHHALSALLFKVGKMPENVVLNSISISGVYSSGACTAMLSDDQEIDFSWSFTGKQQNGTYTEDLSAQVPVAGESIGSEETIFMMLPQEMGENTLLVLSFSINGREYTLEKKFSEIISEWEADKQYVFTIGLPDEIKVEVSDEVDGVVKKHVVIQNGGVATGYIRAAIVGYWVNNDGTVAAPWKPNEDGVFDWGSSWDSYWVKGSDGFYYHKASVESGKFTHPLFETYTLTASTAAGSTHAYQTLEISIMTQIIPESEKALWTELNSISE